MQREVKMAALEAEVGRRIDKGGRTSLLSIRRPASASSAAILTYLCAASASSSVILSKAARILPSASDPLCRSSSSKSIRRPTSASSAAVLGMLPSWPSRIPGTTFLLAPTRPRQGRTWSRFQLFTIPRVSLRTELRCASKKHILPVYHYSPERNTNVTVFQVMKKVTPHLGILQ